MMCYSKWYTVHLAGAAKALNGNAVVMRYATYTDFNMKPNLYKVVCDY